MGSMTPVSFCIERERERVKHAAVAFGLKQDWALLHEPELLRCP